VPALADAMDVMIVRENTEGFYADRNMVVGSGEFMPTHDVALALRKITRKGSERIARSAFEVARTRRKHVTIVHKANVMKVSDGLFLETCRAVAQDYQDVRVDDVLVDAMTSHLVRDPSRYDVIVTTNMFGDILSNMAAELSGGLGLAESLNQGDTNAVAQASHGSAPDLVGKGIANPTALILSAVMLLEWLGVRHQRERFCEAAAELRQAVLATLAQPSLRTPDLKGSGTTSSFTNSVIEALQLGARRPMRSL
jgi:3-isopropylmalate dehydrogenase